MIERLSPLRIRLQRPWLGSIGRRWWRRRRQPLLVIGRHLLFLWRVRWPLMIVVMLLLLLSFTKGAILVSSFRHVVVSAFGWIYVSPLLLLSMRGSEC